MDGSRLFRLRAPFVQIHNSSRCEDTTVTLGLNVDYLTLLTLGFEVGTVIVHTNLRGHKCPLELPTVLENGLLEC